MSTHDLELVQYVSPRGERGVLGTREEASTSATPVPRISHSPWKTLAPNTRLTARGITFLSTPNAITTGANAGGSAVYFHGPNDIVHELVQPPRRAPVAV
jgi:lactoylglutathione lyase